MCCFSFSVIELFSRWLLVQFSTWIASGGDHASILAVTAAVPDQYNREHVDLLWVELAKSGESNFFVVSAELPSDRHRSCALSMFKQDLLRLGELPIPPLRPRVVESDHEISEPCALDTVFNYLPGSEPIAEADRAEVVH